MDKFAIEQKAKRLRRQIYEKRHEFWPGRKPHPLEMLDLEMAARVLGINFHFERNLVIPAIGEKFETGGVLDRQRKTILVATRFGDEVARFTGAHEIGHWLLHPKERVIHRDIPIGGIERDAKDPIEREADYFATVFLMPAHFVRKLFRLMFLTDAPFIFDQATAYHLKPYDVAALLYPEKGSKIREVTLATAKSFNGVRFEKSLAQMFHVSTATMASRITELGLVRAWP